MVNAVGGNLPGAVIPDSKSIFDLSENDFDEVVDLNLKGTIMPSVVFGKVMAKQASGSIINYSSMTVNRVITRVCRLFCSESGNGELYKMDGS